MTLIMTFVITYRGAALRYSGSARRCIASEMSDGTSGMPFGDSSRKSLGQSFGQPSRGPFRDPF